jgi:hypothetical protein
MPSFFLAIVMNIPHLAWSENRTFATTLLGR